VKRIIGTPFEIYGEITLIENMKCRNT